MLCKPSPFPFSGVFFDFQSPNLTACVYLDFLSLLINKTNNERNKKFSKF